MRAQFRGITPGRDVGMNQACGSRSHLRAFAGAYGALTGKDYKAQVLPQAAVDAIPAVPSERCGRK